MIGLMLAGIVAQAQLNNSYVCYIQKDGSCSTTAPDHTKDVWVLLAQQSKSASFMLDSGFCCQSYRSMKSDNPAGEIVGIYRGEDACRKHEQHFNAIDVTCVPVELVP